MAFGVPGFFGAKTKALVPPGLDVTSITDTSGSMDSYKNFITSAGLYEALETALQAESIGVLSATPNKYSFCTADYVQPDFQTIPPLTLDDIERPVAVNGSNQLWALGSDVLAQTVEYPLYPSGTSSPALEDPVGSTNLVSNNDREYNPQNEQIIISGGDLITTLGTFDSAFLYPQRYVGVHPAIISINEVSGLPPIPSGNLVGFVYTTAAEGVAIYFDGSTINYREQMPIAAFKVVPKDFGDIVKERRVLDQCRISNGALYNLLSLTTFESYALLGESLGRVLGKYLYSVS